ncbi:MAG: porphobilinogen synthase [Pseudomonadota bacterium]
MQILGQFPSTRLRRNRQTPWIRSLVAETSLLPSHLVQSVILREEKNPEGPISAMPGVKRHSVAQAVAFAKQAFEAGIPALALFPYTDIDDRYADARLAFDPENVMAKAARAIKQEVPDIGLIGDVALDPYTDHGHDGLLRDGVILNDESIEALQRQALMLAEAGFDVLAPSDMMDGRIGLLRTSLDKAGYQHKLLLSYAVKYASAYYGPYRDAIGCKGVLQGDKRTYQMDFRNRNEALREVAFDIEEGADMVMIKPGLPYLDIIAKTKERFGVPVAAFQVSGEYAMLKCASEAGAFEWEAAGLEALMAFRRAGTDMIISYYATEAAGWLNASS